LNINAKYFGPVDYEEDEIIHIPGGVIGFDSYTKYLPLPFHEEDDSLISLQSLDEGNLSFILMNPFGICPDYAPQLSDQDMKDLEAGSEEDLVYYVISVIRDTIADSTVNLKAPLVINAINRHAKQVILDQPEYTFRHTLGKLETKKED